MLKDDRAHHVPPVRSVRHFSANSSESTAHTLSRLKKTLQQQGPAADDWLTNQLLSAHHCINRRYSSDALHAMRLFHFIVLEGDAALMRASLRLLAQQEGVAALLLERVRTENLFEPAILSIFRLHPSDIAQDALTIVRKKPALWRDCLSQVASQQSLPMDLAHALQLDETAQLDPKAYPAVQLWRALLANDSKQIFDGFKHCSEQGDALT